MSETYIDTISGPIDKYDVPLIQKQSFASKLMCSFAFFGALIFIFILLIFSITWNSEPILVTSIPDYMVKNIKIIDHKATRIYYDLFMITDIYNNTYLIRPSAEHKNGVVTYLYTFEHPIIVSQVYMMLDDSIYWWQDPYTTIEIVLSNDSYAKVVKENIKRRKTAKINIFNETVHPWQSSENIYHNDDIMAIKLMEDGDEYIPYL